MNATKATKLVQLVSEDVMAAATMLQNSRGLVEAQAAKDTDAANELRQLATDLFELLTVMVADEQKENR